MASVGLALAAGHRISPLLCQGESRVQPSELDPSAKAASSSKTTAGGLTANPEDLALARAPQQTAQCLLAG